MRSVFALCGLGKSSELGIRLLANWNTGGLGKTQTALHYVIQNMSKYAAGVAFINASSIRSLSVDFDRLHDLLNLGESKNRKSSVRNWLARPENSQWLLVFDNADDFKSVPVHEYIPAVNWGHVIITSRDQAVIGGLANEGHVLTELTVEDGSRLLLERSGVREPSLDEIEDAKTIAKLLGSHPLALVQAGAFVRSRHRTLADYRKLYLTHRNELFSFVSRTGDTNEAVMTTWKMNFKQVEEESPDATHLLLLLSFLEPSAIPEIVLHRGTSPQRRWDMNGEVAEIRAEDEGVDGSLTKVIQDDFDFDTAVEKLLSFSLISCNTELNGLRNLSIHPLVQYCATQHLPRPEVNRWRFQALLVICHAFPRNKYIDPL